jgi:c-di-GMP-binding flagellar brake protein YcgR
MPKKISSRAPLKNKITEERRKDIRYKCLLPAQVLQAEGKEKLVQRTTVHDFSRGGLKLVVNIITLDPGADVDLDVYVPEKGLKTSVNAEIAWKKMAEDKLEIGLRIKDMKKAAKKEILKWIAPVGLETKKKPKKIAKKK